MREWIRNNKLLVGILAIVVIVGILALWPSDYYIIAPGIAKELAPMVDIKEQTYPVKGEIMLTAVSMRGASLLEHAYVKLVQPEFVELQSRNFLPPEMSMQEYFKFMKEVMVESQMKAKAVALKEAGYNSKITGEGVEIVKVLETGDAYGKLKEGDIIVAIDEESVQLLTETVNKIQNRESGDKVTVTVKREDKRKTYQLEAKAMQENDNKPSIGVLITPYKREYDFPIEIEINAGDIGGPSAGSMFALEIYNQLTEEDLTHGIKIAGTGTIDLEGNVGKIDGVKQKIVAAKENGVEVFFTPKGNAKRAEEMKGEGIEIVVVETIDDIISYLEERGV